MDKTNKEEVRLFEQLTGYAPDPQPDDTDSSTWKPILSPDEGMEPICEKYDTKHPVNKGR